MNLAKAKFDNLAECPDELAFRRGDILTVIDQNLEGLSGWWLCSQRGKQGIVPANRLTLLAGMYNESSLLFTTDSSKSGYSGRQVSAASSEGPEYDVPRSYRQSPHKTGVAETLNQSVYDSPRNQPEVNDISRASVPSSAEVQDHLEPVYDQPLPSSISFMPNNTSMRYSNTVDSAIDSFNNSDRSSSLYDYPSSLSDGYSTASGGGLTSEQQLSRYSTSSNAVYDNNTSYLRSTASTRHSADSNDSHFGNLSGKMADKQVENMYDIVPPINSRQAPSNNTFDTEERTVSFLPDDLDLDSVLQILVKLQQLIHTSIARLKVDCPSLFSSSGHLAKTRDSGSFQTLAQTLLTSLRRLVEVAQHCTKQALQSRNEQLASSLDQQLSPLLKSVKSLNALTKSMQPKTQTLSSVCHDITENVTKLASLIHGNITLLFEQTQYSEDNSLNDLHSQVSQGSGNISKSAEDSVTNRSTAGYDEYDYCEVKQMVLQTVMDSKQSATASVPVIGGDGEHYIAFHLMHIKLMEEEVRSLLQRLETDGSMASADGLHRGVLLAVHKTVYTCDALERAISNDTPAAALLVSRLVAIVNTLCISIKKMVLMVNTSRTGRTGGNNSKQLMGIANEIRSSYRQLITMLEQRSE